MIHFLVCSYFGISYNQPSLRTQTYFRQNQVTAGNTSAFAGYNQQCYLLIIFSYMQTLALLASFQTKLNEFEDNEEEDENHNNEAENDDDDTAW